MSSDLRRIALGAAAACLATLSCGTIQAVSHDSKDEWFPGVHHDLDSVGHTAGDENPSDPVSAACTAACLGIPVVIEGALRIVDLPFSFIADLVVMPFRTPVESDGNKQDFESPPAREQGTLPERDAAEVAPGEEVVATVLGRSIQRSELDSAALDRLICRPLVEKYRADHGIVATESEIAEYVAFFRKFSATEEAKEIFGDIADPEETSDADSLRSIAESSILDWKTSQRMYEEFGGVVIFQQANPLEPVGAYLAFLRAQEKAHAFEILDAALAPSFWEYFTREQEFVVDPEQVDYSKPWWKRE